MWLKNYYINCIKLKKFVLGLKGEHKWDLLKIHYTNLFEWWKNVGILDIFKEKYNMYTKDCWEKEKEKALNYV